MCNKMMEYNPFSLEGKTVLVTGASSGIGRSTAIECSRLGANVIITARNRERLEETLSKMEGNNNKTIIADLNNGDQRCNLVKECPLLDGISLNAGIVIHSPVKFIKEEKFLETFGVNTLSPIQLLALLLKNKKLNKGSSIVFTSSIAGVGLGSIGDGEYSASKGALSAFVPVAAKELAVQRIRVNAVCPAMIQTNMTMAGTFTEEQNEENMRKYPLGRWGKPEEVAWAIIYLLSDASSFTTGTNLIINGGL